MCTLQVIIEQCEQRNTKLQHTEMFVVADGDELYVSSIDFVNKDDWILKQRGKLTVSYNYQCAVFIYS